MGRGGEGTGLHPEAKTEVGAYGPRLHVVVAHIAELCESSLLFLAAFQLQLAHDRRSGIPYLAW